MTADQRSRGATITGRILVAAGTIIVVAWAGLLGVAYVSPYTTEHTVTSSVAFLNGAARDAGSTCLLTPADGATREVTVPPMPGRGIHTNGVLVRTPSQPTSIVCTEPIHLTQGLLAPATVLTEHWLILMLGLLIAATGLHRLGLFRHTSRYP